MPQARTGCSGFFNVSAHHSPFEAGMFLVGPHLLLCPGRGTLLAYALARPKFHPTGLVCNEHGAIYAISSDFGDRMTTQSMGLMFLLSEHF